MIFNFLLLLTVFDAHVSVQPIQQTIMQRLQNNSRHTVHSASSFRASNGITSSINLLPTVRLNPLNIGSASSFYIPSLSVNSCFHNGPRVLLSPLKASIVRETRVNIRNIRLGRRRVYHKITKCNAKRCMCCKFLSTKPNIKSTVNGRVFNVIIDQDLDCSSSHIIYVLT